MKADGYSGGQGSGGRGGSSQGSGQGGGRGGSGQGSGQGSSQGGGQGSGGRGGSGQGNGRGGSGANYSSDSGYSGGGQCSGYSGGSSGYRGAGKEIRSPSGDGERPVRSEYSRPWRADYTRSQKQWDDAESPAYQELKAQLTEYYRRGVKVSLGGVRMPVWKIAQICAVREEGKYMGDYIIDEAGELIEVRFDRVSR